MSNKLDRRSFLSRTTGTLLASSIFPAASHAAGSPLMGGIPGAELSGDDVILTSEQTGIFPRPHEMTELPGQFLLNEETEIILPGAASRNDLLLSRFLIDELSNRYGVQPHLRHESALPEGNRFILMGSISNPLVREFCRRNRPDFSAENPGPEGYFLQVSDQAAVVAGCDERGAYYGLQSLRQLIGKRDGKLQIRAARVRDWPDKPFRGVYLYLPGRDNIPLFKRFVHDVMAQYKFNTIMIEMNACMRFDSHPELNEGWVEFTRDTDYSRRNYPPGPLHGREQNSSHQDCCDGSFLEKAEVADLVEWCRQHHIEVIPAIPSLTHSFYLLTKHKDLSEVPGDKWPDTYCASNPGSYKLLFDVMDEFIDVMKPRMVHTGHDEWFAPFGLCPCCKSKDPGEVYGHDLIKIHDYLAGKNIKMAIWGDYLLESVRGKGLQKHVTHDGWVYYSPGAMTPQQVKELVPKDILILNWFWSERRAGKSNEAQLDEFGFRQIYGNLEPSIHDYPERSQRKTLMGGAPSAWEATNEFNFGKDLIYSFLGCSNLLWSTGIMKSPQLSSIVQASIPNLRRNLSGQTPPSDVGDPVIPIDISASFNMPMRESTFAVDLGGMQNGTVKMGTMRFNLASPGATGGKGVVMVGTEGRTHNPLPREVRGIKIERDVTSLIFLHACAVPATNKEAYRLIWDMHDSADLLGWYEVVYDDGLPELIPIRYGVNILEWNWRKHPHRGAYCYGADEVNCGQGSSPISFFALEWPSPRLGQVIREVNLKGSTHFRGAVPGFENAFGKVIPSNAVLLKAISFVKSRA